MKYIYEDTTNKKVYFYDTTHQKDSLIYDFNLQVGDTFYSNFWGSICSSIVVERTLDFFAGINRIKISFSDYPNIAWYEGVGSLYGLFDNPCNWQLTGGYYSEMLCYFEDSTLLYHNSSLLDTCFGSTQIKEIHPEKTFQTYFSNGNLFIKPTNISSYTFTLYNLIGKKLIEQKVNGNLELNLTILSKGLYIYTIYSDNSKYRLNDKLMITK